MKALHRKLLRDIGNMRGAVFTISLVVAAGIAAFVTLRGTWLSISHTRDRYYSAERFGDVFAQLERAPNALADKLAALPGVARVYTRVFGEARVPMADLPEPAQARVISLPESGRVPLNAVRLRTGRMPMSDRDDEALLIELFAEKHGVREGSTLDVVMEGRMRTLRVVGTAMSPEFVLAVPNGAAAPAPERFAVLWMPRAAAEAAYDMRGSFNSVVLDLAPGAPAEPVLAQVDALLDRYGGLGAQSRARQVSHYFLSQDLAQLSTLATVAPLIFLGVAAFLLNVVLSRLIELDRPQIATLKAIGYGDREVGLHYLQLTLIITAAGALLGVALGIWLGGHMTGLYVKFYRMPNLAFTPTHSLLATALVVSMSAGLLGSALAVRRVIQLPPAEAMRPAAPPSYAQGALTRSFLRLLTPSARMVARELTRRPIRTVLSALGIAAATGVMVIGQHFSNAMDYLVDVYMQASQRETVAVSFVNPVRVDELGALRLLPGVRDVQARAVLPIRIRAGHRRRDVSVIGHPARPFPARPLLDGEGRALALAPGSLVLTDVLARALHVQAGDTVVIEPLVGDRTPRRVQVTGTAGELMAMWVHMRNDDLARLLHGVPMAQQALLTIDRDQLDAAQRELLQMPQVASALRKDVLVAEFRKQQGDTMRTFSRVLTLFAITIALSVVYNNARVALSLRARELASLRVLGFTRQEISAVLISELAVQVLLGMPLGLLLGQLFVSGMLAANDPESFRFPAHVGHPTYAFAALVTVLAATVSALLVRRKLDQLDLIGVLKTRE